MGARFAFDIDAGGEFHTFRLESIGVGPSYRFYRDGVLIGTEIAPASSTNGWGWGDGSWGNLNDADIDWDWIRFAQDCIPIAVQGATWTGVKASPAL